MRLASHAGVIIEHHGTRAVDRLMSAQKHALELAVARRSERGASASRLGVVRRSTLTIDQTGTRFTAAP